METSGTTRIKYLDNLIDTINGFDPKNLNFLCFCIEDCHLEELQHDLCERFGWDRNNLYKMPCIVSLAVKTDIELFQEYLSVKKEMDFRFALQQQFAVWAIEKRGYEPVFDSLTNERLIGYK